MTVRIDAATENLMRGLAPRVLAVLTRRYGDFADAEDAVQEALVAASVQWPKHGVPANPRAWLVHVASRRMSDHARSEIARRRREALVQSQFDLTTSDIDFDEPSEDDTLALMFMCAHPELSRTSAIALTLRAIGGLTTAEIAKAYLVPEATMAQRISRAKARIQDSGVPFRMPVDEERSDRLAGVLHVLYLIFNEGYASSGGACLLRSDLASEAIRLGRMVHRLLPGETEVAGLLALMLLTDARRAARSGPDGELIPLNEQDRSLWDRAEIIEGSTLIEHTFSQGSIGSYQLQAAIAALHDEAAHASETDWPQILALYTVLERISENPMVSLNRAVAVAMVHGASAGLELLDKLESDKRLAEHYRLLAVRAHLLEMAHEYQQAVASYRAAAQKTASIPERNYLAGKAARLATGADQSIR